MFCPILIASLDSDAPILAARWPVLEPLFTAAEFVQTIVLMVGSLTIPGFDPQWYFKVTGELPDSATDE